MKLERKAATSILHIDSIKILFSYDKAIALFDGQEACVYVDHTFYSVTTTKHKNAFLDHLPDNTEQISYGPMGRYLLKAVLERG